MSSSTSSWSTGGQSDGQGIRGSPIQIIKVNENKTLELDTDALSSVLLNPLVKDKPMVVISVAGDFRKGKSFLLNFFLRYLISFGFPNWMGDRSSPLKGFLWRSGVQGHTEGIHIWSEPFVVPLWNPSGNRTEVAIVLMDTQGVFSRGLSLKESVTVFALSTLLSSVQVFNLKNNIQENDLQSLEIFTEYGRLALEVNNEKPFQRLMFLIRDWENPRDYSYGLNGGQKFLDECLVIDETNENELKRVRRNIRKYFSTTECFLMPHPGDDMTNKRDFDGRIAYLDSKFVNNLETFVEHIFKPENLSVKKIGGREVNGIELMQYFKQYTNSFMSDKIPEPKTIFKATVEANNLNALIMSKDLYKSSMDKVCGTGIEFIEQEMLLQNHQQYYNDALNAFDKTPKIGSDEFSRDYRTKLDDYMKRKYEDYKIINSQKKSKFLQILTTSWNNIKRSLVSTFGLSLHLYLLKYQLLIIYIYSGIAISTLSNKVASVYKICKEPLTRKLKAIADEFTLIKNLVFIIVLIILIYVIFNIQWYILQFLWGIVRMFYNVLMILWWLISNAFTLIFRVNN